MTRTPALPRRDLLRTASLASLAGALLPPRLFAAPDGVPRSVTELWADFDPRREPLETEVIREWREDGGVFRLVRYRIGAFKGVPARMAAIYGFPEGAAGKLPAVMHIHGGGQRAFLNEVKLMVSRGYAALSVNWGGSAGNTEAFNHADAAKPDEPNTDWGAVDPSQRNVAGYNSVLPGPKQFFEDREHPKNNNWYLLTLGCRRGLTFLEQQPEVDPSRLGVHGYSMGGNLTMYVAGTDDRVKAAVPAVGGSGWRWQAHDLPGGRAQPDNLQGNVEMYRQTLSFESYSPHIRCPVLHRSATNDFHGWMDDVYRTNALIPNQPTRYSFAPHLNHRLTPEVEVSLPLWMDQHLKGGPAIPDTPGTRLSLENAGQVPALRVSPQPHAWPVARVEVYYSVDSDPRARFWRSAEVTRDEGGTDFVAQLPLHTLDLPLFAFANVHYTLPQPVSLAGLPGHGEPVRELCLSSLLRHADPAALAAAGVKATLTPQPLLDDFRHGLRDWYQLNAGNLTHRQTWTRKVTDPLFRGPEGAKLSFTLRMPKDNRIHVVIQQNEWRNYRGPRRTFVCARDVAGREGEQTLVLSPADFIDADGKPLAGWAEVDQLGVCAHFADRKAKVEATLWKGPEMRLVKVEWA